MTIQQQQQARQQQQQLQALVALRPGQGQVPPQNMANLAGPSSMPRGFPDAQELRAALGMTDQQQITELLQLARLPPAELYQLNVAPAKLALLDKHRPALQKYLVDLQQMHEYKRRYNAAAAANGAANGQPQPAPRATGTPSFLEQPGPLQVAPNLANASPLTNMQRQVQQQQQQQPERSAAQMVGPRGPQSVMQAPAPGVVNQVPQHPMAGQMNQPGQQSRPRVEVLNAIEKVKALRSECGPKGRLANISSFTLVLMLKGPCVTFQSSSWPLSSYPLSSG